MDIREKISKFPDNPGIYLFYNSKKELVYVGKATSLRSRVGSYFAGQNLGKLPLPPLGKRGITRPIEQMIHEVVDIKTIQTGSVLEAIILEANYIKKFQPKYNVDLKDDKSWVHICVTKDQYPRVTIVREHELKNDKFPISNFQYNFGPYPGLKTREMMKLLQKLFYISTCQLPAGKQNKQSRQIKQMKPCFYYQLGQCLGVCTGEITPSDYKKKVIKPLVQFLSGKKKSLLKNLEKDMKQASRNHEFEEAGRLRDQINQLQRIQDVALLNRSFVEDREFRNLEIKKLNNFRIEGYDISNLGSSNMVGSMVVFENNEPNKNQYRKFKIKSVEGQSDVDCLAEMLERRLNHVSPSFQEGVGGVAEAWPLPQVILIDGGASQVNKAVEVLRLRKFKIPVVGIVKGSERKRNDFLIGFKNREFIKWVNENKNLLIKVRDEAHRFAISYQKKLRRLKY